MQKLSVNLNEEQKDILYYIAREKNLSLAGVLRYALEELRPANLPKRSILASETEKNNYDQHKIIS